MRAERSQVTEQDLEKEVMVVMVMMIDYVFQCI